MSLYNQYFGDAGPKQSLLLLFRILAIDVKYSLTLLLPIEKHLLISDSSSMPILQCKKFSIVSWFHFAFQQTW